MLISKKDKLALTFKDAKYTYTQLLRYSQIYADSFSAESKPEKVLICAQNSPEWCFAFYGTMRCKAIAVPLDQKATDDYFDSICAEVSSCEFADDIVDKNAEIEAKYNR